MPIASAITYKNVGSAILRLPSSILPEMGLWRWFRCGASYGLIQELAMDCPAPVAGQRESRLEIYHSVAIALGANLGQPFDTLLTVRPLLEKVFLAGSNHGCSTSSPPSSSSPRCRWSPLFRTEPVGGPPDQPPYLNAVLLVDQIPADPGFTEACRWWRIPMGCLNQLQNLERRFGRQRHVRWGPRTLDLDLLWWGDHRMDTPRADPAPSPAAGEKRSCWLPWRRSMPLLPCPLLPPLAPSPAGTCWPPCCLASGSRHRFGSHPEWLA
jgi:2-amino-4-hydroxy-6-hydroxymethyldihydropteridine diphosphokinase